MVRLVCVILCVCFLGFPARSEEMEKYVALTFDDGPSGRFTTRLLEGLAERQAKATFFLCGYRLKDYPDTARAIFEAGHEIGVHGYSHRDMGKMSKKEALQEIENTVALLPEGCRPAFLRPPGGKVGKGLEAACHSTGLSVLNWSVDPKDWENHDAAAVETAVVSQVQAGDVILLHDMYDGSVDAALSIIDRLQEQGFRFVTVSELAALSGVIPQVGVVYRRF